MELAETIQVARGERVADLVLKNARVVNVFSGDIHDTNVAIYHTRVVGLGDYNAKREIDLKGAYVCPSFINAHVHIESSMVSVREFARTVVPRGTTTVITDPHEIANVMGFDGIKYIKAASKYNPMSNYIMLPSCVPATHLETSGSSLTAYDLKLLIDDPWILGIAEMMNYPGVLARDPEVLEKISLGNKKLIDGHAPGLSGRDLNAYVAAGIRSDHECTTIEEAREKLRLGMHIMIREGSTARNLRDLLPLVTAANSRRCMFCTDDRHPADLIDEGDIDSIIRTAIDMGLNPITAIQMATLNPAQYFGLNENGAVAPGYRADLVVFEGFTNFHIRQVYRGGKLVAEEGEMLPLEVEPKSIRLRSSMNVNWSKVDGLEIPAQGEKVRVIGLIPNQLITEMLIEDANVVDGQAVSDVVNDILKVAVLERHMASGNVGLGFVKGMGLKRGAIGSSVAHDSHNLIVVGTNDADMMAVAHKIVDMGGGLAATVDGKTVAELPLPIAGLMSEKPIETVRRELGDLQTAAHELGCAVAEPFMMLSFLALPVIPNLKLTDKGLVDVNKFDFVPLFE